MFTAFWVDAKKTQIKKKPAKIAILLCYCSVSRIKSFPQNPCSRSSKRSSSVLKLGTWNSSFKTQFELFILDSWSSFESSLSTYIWPILYNVIFFVALCLRLLVSLQAASIQINIIWPGRVWERGALFWKAAPGQSVNDIQTVASGIPGSGGESWIFATSTWFSVVLVVIPGVCYYPWVLLVFPRIGLYSLGLFSISWFTKYSIPWDWS